jgi:hypothetical protein
MSASAWAAIAGLLSGAVTSLVGWVLTRRDTRTRLDLAKQESDANVQKTVAETEQIRLEIEQTRRAALAEVAGAVRYLTSPQEARVVFDGRDRLDPFDFHKEELYGAQARLAEQDGMLVIVRDNTEGNARIRLESYANPEGRGTVLERLGDSADDRRHLRVRCQLRAVDAEHTVLLRLVARNALPDEWLGRWRERLTPGAAWVSIDWYVELPAAEDIFFRIEDRSVSNAPSSVQMRNLVITERPAP